MYDVIKGDEYVYIKFKNDLYYNISEQQTVLMVLKKIFFLRLSFFFSLLKG